MKKLFEPIDNAPLVIFRMLFGFLLFAESIGAICTGWVYRVFIQPEFTFSHIGLDWLQPLPGFGMYVYFVVMGLFGLMVMLGYRYRLGLGMFTVMWAGVYFMQKESYNNHYYLLLLVCLIMWFQPANRYASLDANRRPEIKTNQMPRWCSFVMIFQISIVYFFAVLSKLYPQWLNGEYIRLLLTTNETGVFVKGLFDQHWFHLFISWSGLLFDLLIVPALLWKRTRTIAFVGAIFFHLFNAIVLQIGIFPFFALGFVLFFYPPQTIRKVFFKNKEAFTEVDSTQTYSRNMLYFFIPYFILQLALPLRHHLIKGDVLWTEEGHRLSWRMMLRQKGGYVVYRIVDQKTGKSTLYELAKHLTPKQQGFAATKPDGIWQLSQRIKKEYAAQGQQVSVYVQALVSVNGGPLQSLIDPKVDMGSAEWDYFGHNEWILLYE